MGLLAMTLAVAQCGDGGGNDNGSDVGSPPPGTFTGTLSDGGSIRLEVGSIDEIAFTCGNLDIQEIFSPPRPVDANGRFAIELDDGGHTFQVRGTFQNADAVTGTIDDEEDDCDVSFQATRRGSRTPTPTTAVTPGPSTSDDPTPTLTPTVVVTDSETTPTVTPTPTPHPSVSGSPCPIALEVVGTAGSAKALDSGWTGLAHNATVVSDGKLTFNLSNCDHAVRACGDCDITGPIQNAKAGQGDIDPHRCSNDTSQQCENDAGCATPGKCVFYFGAPLPLSAGGLGTCVLNQVNGPVTGTANVESGAFTSTINLTARVFNGDTNNPCPNCVGDPTPNDGTRGGTCARGTRDGQPCDANGTSPIPSFGTTSLDCPPTGFISSLSIPLSGSSGNETKTLTAQSPPCQAAPGKKCFCAAQSGGEPTKPNACLDNTATPDTDEGLCAPTTGSKGECPFTGDTVCSPTETFRGCLNNGDCTAPGDTCQSVHRPCYLDNGVVGGSVSAIGMADPPTSGTAHPTFAALFCIPPVGQAAVNAAGGLPGLGRLELPLTTKEILP